MKRSLLKALLIVLILAGTVIGTINFTSSNTKAADQEVDWGTWNSVTLYWIITWEDCVLEPTDCCIVTAYVD